MRVLSAAIFIFTSLIFSTQAFACSCALPSGWISEIIGDQIILRGNPSETKVVPIDTKFNERSQRFKHQLVTRFNITQNIGGSLNGEIEIFHDSYPSSCAVQLDLNREQWIIANKRKGKIEIHSCSYQSDLIVEMIEYIETGQDIYIPPISTCEALLESKKPNLTSQSGLSKNDCAFWSKENQRKKHKLLRNYYGNHIYGCIPEFIPPR